MLESSVWLGIFDQWWMVLGHISVKYYWFNGRIMKIEQTYVLQICLVLASNIWRHAVIAILRLPMSVSPDDKLRTAFNTHTTVTEPAIPCKNGYPSTKTYFRASTVNNLWTVKVILAWLNAQCYFLAELTDLARTKSSGVFWKLILRKAVFETHSWF